MNDDDGTDPVSKPQPDRSRRLSAWAQLTVGCMVLLTVAVLAWVTLNRTPQVNAGTLPAAPGTTSAVRIAPARPASSLPTRPVRLRLPALNIDAPVVAVGVSPDGSLGVPGDIHGLGWWAAGPAPGSTTGTVVIDGHVDSAAAGPGAFFTLAHTPLGATVTVNTSTGPATYIVTGRRTYPKDALPPGLFSRTSTPQLVLITCGGQFDHTTGHYQNNTVIYATPR